MMFLRVTQPETEPITLAQARRYLRIDGEGYTGDTSRNEDIAQWIKAARRYVENATDQSIGIQTLMVTLDSFMPRRWADCPQPLAELPAGPVFEIVSIVYVDPDGNDATVDPSIYKLTLAPPQCVWLRPNQRWPDARREPESVRITYRAGFDASASLAPGTVIDSYADNYADNYTESVTIPGTPGDPSGAQPLGDDLLQAMRFLLGLYASHSSADIPIAAQELPLGVRALLWPNRASIGL